MEENIALKSENECTEQTPHQSAAQTASPQGEAIEELEWQLLMELQKNAGEEAWRGKLQFSHSAAVIKGLAIMIQQCASDLDVPVGNVVARLATVLLAPREEVKSGQEK